MTLHTSFTPFFQVFSHPVPVPRVFASFPYKNMLMWLKVQQGMTHLLYGAHMFHLHRIEKIPSNVLGNKKVVILFELFFFNENL